MMKRIFFSVLFTALIAVVNAQSNFGTDNFYLGELKIAKDYFEKQLSQTPAESNYYLGEIAFAEGKLDDAKAYYEKGIAASAVYNLNYVGQGKLLLKTDPAAAKVIFDALAKKNKKDFAVALAIARAYFDCGLNDLGQLRLLQAKKLGKKAPAVFILEGDLLKDENKGAAAAKYEQATYFDPNNLVAAIKYAQIYEALNAQSSIEFLKKIIAAHPEYTVVYKSLGRSYNANGQYKTAIESYKAYFKDSPYNVEDLVRFASAYYFTDQYTESQELVFEGLKLAPEDFVLNRLRMYNAAKLKDKDPKALKYAEYFFSLKGKYLPLDYTANAIILADSGDFTKALELFNSVLATDAKNPEIYKELYTLYTKMGDKVKAVENFQQYIDLTGAEYVAPLDFFKLGQAYYSAGSTLFADSIVEVKEQGRALIAKADSAFATLCKLTPESYTGFYWRGNTNSLLDPETTLGLAKPFYEAAVTIMETKNKTAATVGYQKELIRCYSYIGVLAFKKDDKETTIKYMNQILALDPTNAMAKSILDSYNPVVKEVKKK